MPDDDTARPERTRSVLPFTLLGVFAVGVLGYRLVGELGRLHTRGGWTVFALYVAGAVLLLAALAAVVARRRPGGDRPPGVAAVLVVAALVGAIVVPTAGVGTAEVVTCLRGQGPDVAATFVRVEPRNRSADVVVYRYDVDGERYTLQVREDDQRTRETAPGRYRVPWVGSDRACGTERDGDGPALALHLLVGLAAALVAGGALGGALRRRRRPDESGDRPGSDPA